MGRRSRDHCYLKYIILLDNNGNVSQKYQLDDNGRLLEDFYRPQKLNPSPSYPVNSNVTNTSIPPQNSSTALPIPQIQLSYPIPPVMRQKIYNNFTVVHSTPINFTDLVAEEDLPNVVDIRPLRLQMV